MDWDAIAPIPNFPYLELPEAPGLPGPILDVPQADLPNYKPLVVPPNTLRPPPGIKGFDGDTYDEAPKDTKPEATPATPVTPYDSLLCNRIHISSHNQQEQHRDNVCHHHR